MVGGGVGAKCGILFKNAEAMEALARCRTVALDKTGTVTLGELRVVEIVPIGVSKGELFDKLFKHSLESKTGAGVVSYNFLAGEPLAYTEKGAPMVVRSPDGDMNLASFMQSQIYSAVAALALGMDILKREGVRIDSVLAHGGFYKTPVIGQIATSAVLEAPVTVMKTAAEGGAWGMAVLALYRLRNELPLNAFLSNVFKDAEKTELSADAAQVAQCRAFLAAYRKGIAAEKAASEVFA
jgi:sugar (pentulose or hexulose) kinase